MSKVENTVKKCNRCDSLYEVKVCNPDWQVTYLGEPYDLCDNCYNYVVPILGKNKIQIPEWKKDKPIIIN